MMATTEKTSRWRLSVSTLNALFALFASTNVFAIDTLPEFNASYAVQKSGIKVAQANYDLSYTDNGYQFTQNTELFGTASVSSRNRTSITSYIEKVRDNLLLTTHTHSQIEEQKNIDESYDILWRATKGLLSGTITGTVKGKKIELIIDSEVWDILSFQIPLMLEANGNVKEYPYQAISNGKVADYNLLLIDTKKIILDNKKYNALHLRYENKNKSRQFHIWLLPDLHNIPAIIERYRDGKQYSRLQLESVTFNNKESYTAKKIEND